jgi:hypothetical protein
MLIKRLKISKNKYKNKKNNINSNILFNNKK